MPPNLKFVLFLKHDKSKNLLQSHCLVPMSQNPTEAK